MHAIARTLQKLLDGLTLAFGLVLALVVHQTIQMLRPWYVADTAWATSFYQEHLTVWEYRGLAAAILIIAIALLSHTIHRQTGGDKWSK